MGTQTHGDRCWSGGWQVQKFGEVGTMLVRCAHSNLVCLRPLEVEMHRMFPGHADATMQLDRFLSRLHGDIRAVCLRYGDGDVGVVAALRKTIGGISGRGVGRPDLKPQVRKAMLERLI